MTSGYFSIQPFPPLFSAELYIVHKVQIKISSLRWSEKKVQIKVHAWTWTWAVILSSHKLTVLNAHQWSDVSLWSKLKFKFRHELWSELFLKLTQRPDLICELKIRIQVWPAIQLWIKQRNGRAETLGIIFAKRSLRCLCKILY